MALTLAPLLRDGGIDLADAIVIRHAYVPLHEDTRSRNLNPSSTDAEILAYTRNQSVTGFPAAPLRHWVVFIKMGWRRGTTVVRAGNPWRGEQDGIRREFDLVETGMIADLQSRLVIQWEGWRGL